MDKYKAPKGLKIKKKKMPKVKLGQESEAGLGTMDLTGDKAKPAKTEGPSLVDKPAKGKIIRIKTKGKSKMTEIDAKSITKEEGKKALERARYKNELKIKKKIKGLK